MDIGEIGSRQKELPKFRFTVKEESDHEGLFVGKGRWRIGDDLNKELTPNRKTWNERWSYCSQKNELPFQRQVSDKTHVISQGSSDKESQVANTKGEID